MQYTPIRNVWELRTCKPKLKDFARGEVNEIEVTLLGANTNYTINENMTSSMIGKDNKKEPSESIKWKHQPFNYKESENMICSLNAKENDPSIILIIVTMVRYTPSLEPWRRIIAIF